MPATFVQQSTWRWLRHENRGIAGGAAVLMSHRIEIIGNATLHLGDCRDILSEISADVAIADPVYGISRSCGSGLRKSRKSKSLYNSSFFEDTQDYVLSAMIPAAKIAIARFGRAAITPGVRHMRDYPRPAHVGSFQYPASTVMSCWGPMLWQPVLYYGKDPHQGRLVPDSFTGCNDI